jgi:hypothetical protein
VGLGVRGGVDVEWEQQQRGGSSSSVGSAAGLAGAWCNGRLLPPMPSCIALLTRSLPDNHLFPRRPQTTPCLQVRDWISGTGVDNIGKRLVNSREGKVEFDKPSMDLSTLMKYGELAAHRTAAGGCRGGGAGRRAGRGGGGRRAGRGGGGRRAGRGGGGRRAGRGALLCLTRVEAVPLRCPHTLHIVYLSQNINRFSPRLS